MDLDDLLHHYLGAAEPDMNDGDAIETAAARMAVDFGIERDPGRRFALWALMHALGCAPDPEIAFKDRKERAAAQNYARLAVREGHDRSDDPII